MSSVLMALGPTNKLTKSPVSLEYGTVGKNSERLVVSPYNKTHNTSGYPSIQIHYIIPNIAHIIKIPQNIKTYPVNIDKAPTGYPQPQT